MNPIHIDYSKDRPKLRLASARVVSLTAVYVSHDDDHSEVIHKALRAAMDDAEFMEASGPGPYQRCTETEAGGEVVVTLQIVEAATPLDPEDEAKILEHDRAVIAGVQS